MRVAFINPPRFNEITGTNPSFIEEDRGKNPPLGLLYVASYMKKNSDEFEIEFIDAQLEDTSYEELEQLIIENKFDIVGITTMTQTMVDVLELAKIVKKCNSKTKIVVGGHHTAIYPKETAELENIDFVVVGEGEETFLELAQALKNNTNLKDVNGLVYQENGKIVFTKGRETKKDLDSLPFPDREFTEYKKYTSLLTRYDIATTIITTRGCPFKCTFCDRPTISNKIRYRSAQNIVDEIEECLELGIKNFIFYDDTFTVNKKRVIEFCELVISKKLDITWNIRTRVDTVDEEMIIALKKAGCVGINYGVEAGNDKIMKNLKKGITVEQVKQAFAITQKHKVSTVAFFMIGNPGEELSDIEDSFNLAIELNPTYYHLNILTPFPSTELYLSALREGVIKEDYWLEFAKNPIPNIDMPALEENFSRKELEELQKLGYKKFYTRLSYMFQQFLAVRTLPELYKKSKAGFKLIVKNL